MKREMILGALLLCALLLFWNPMEAMAFDDPRKYGVEFRGGFSLYQVSDTRDVMDYYQSSASAVVTENYAGPSGGFSLLWRQEKHFQWNIGYNSLVNFESEAKWHDTTLTLSARASEFFVLGNFVFDLTRTIPVYFGGGVNFVIVKQDILRKPGYSVFDGTGRAFGAMVNGAIEIPLGRRAGLCLGAGYRLADITELIDVNFNDERSKVVHPLVNRAWEADLSGPTASVGLRLYFDPVSKPVDFSD